MFDLVFLLSSKAKKSLVGAGWFLGGLRKNPDESDKQMLDHKID